MRWPLISYTDELADGVAGDARGPVIRIRKGYEADDGLYQHELRHVMQWLVVGLLLGLINGIIAWLLAPFGGLTPIQAALGIGISAFIGAHPALYLGVRAYRQTAEADAYRAQMNYPDRKGGFLSLESAAFKLAAPRYRLDITFDQALELLRD